MWLGLLEQSRSFHQNYHKTTVTFGEFLCGMASLKRTPLARHFEGLQGAVSSQSNLPLFVIRN